jgi:biotin carboxylase
MLPHGPCMNGPTSVAFVAPFFAETTLRFLDATTRLPGVHVLLVSQDPADRLPPGLRARLAAHERVTDGLDPHAILDAIRHATPRLARPATRVIGALEQLQVPLAEVRQALGVSGLSVDAARNFRDKARMKDVLRAAGVPCARHHLAQTPDEARAAARSIGYPLVAKPPAGAGARGTYRVESDAQLEDVVRASPPTPAAPLLLEEFIRGDEHSFDAVTIHGRPVWHSLTHYSPGPLEVLRHPWIQWTVLLPREVDHPRYDDIRSVAARALAALGMGTGLSHMEWFRRTDGSVTVSEVGARPPGAQFTTLISYAHDVDFYAAWARLLVFEEFDPPPRRYAAGIAFLRGQGEGRVTRIAGLGEAQAELGQLVVEVKLPKAGQLPGSSYEGEGYVVLRHPETEVVARALARLVQLVRVELA